MDFLSSNLAIIFLHGVFTWRIYSRITIHFRAGTPDAILAPPICDTCTLLLMRIALKCGVRDILEYCMRTDAQLAGCHWLSAGPSLPTVYQITSLCLASFTVLAPVLSTTPWLACGSLLSAGVRLQFGRASIRAQAGCSSYRPSTRQAYWKFAEPKKPVGPWIAKTPDRLSRRSLTKFPLSYSAFCLSSWGKVRWNSDGRLMCYTCMMRRWNSPSRLWGESCRLSPQPRQKKRNMIYPEPF